MHDARTSWVIFLLPLVLLVAMVLLKIEAPLHYKSLVREDGLVENFQFVLFFGAGIVAILAGRRLGAAGLKLHCGLYWLLGIGLLVVAMDEISWGQRLFGFATPERVAAVNFQSELTIHNLKPLMIYLHVAYLCVGSYGSFGWLVNKIWPPGQQSLRRFVIADWYLASYFAILLLVYGLIELAQWVQPSLFGQRLVIGEFIVFRDQEPAELMLALAMAIFVLINYRRAGTLGSL
jgi:hypothetical protein